MPKRVTLPDIVVGRLKVLLSELGFTVCARYEGAGGVQFHSFSRPHENGTVVVAIGVAFSCAGSLFVRIGIGLDSPVLTALLEEIQPGLAAELSLPYALLGWSIGDTCAVGFDPSPHRPGCEFILSTPLVESEIKLTLERLPQWIGAAEEFLWRRPLYEFYRNTDYIDQSDGRWREMLAILKIIGGERYVGHQLLLDLKAEGCGKRPYFGEWYQEWSKDKPNAKERLFQEQLCASVRDFDGNLSFGAGLKLVAARNELEWGKSEVLSIER